MVTFVVILIVIACIVGFVFLGRVAAKDKAKRQRR